MESLDFENPCAFELLGLSAQEVDKFMEDKKEKKPNNQVCSCGHAMNKHTKTENGIWSCNTARMWCPCQYPIPVVEASDTKYFMTKSYGYGAKHALATGLRRSQLKGVSTKLIVEAACFKCKATRVELLPAGLSRHNEMLDIPAPRNGIFCRKCIYSFLGISTVPLEET